jgi:hypothetical protein
MIRTRIGLLGLCAMMLGVMAFSASAAQAEPGAFWLVNKAKLPEALLPTIAATLENSMGTLLGELVGIKFHILCTGAELKEFHLVAPAGALGFGRFTGCTALKLNAAGGTEPLLECRITETALGGTVGAIITSKIKGLIVLHEGEGAVKFEPEAGVTLAIIHFEEGCLIGESFKIGGVFAAKDCQKAFLTDQVTHLFEELKALTSLFLNGNKEKVVTTDGSANATLSGAHAGQTFAGHPA